MASESAALNGLGDPSGPTFEWRTATTFKVVAVFALFVSAIVVTGTGQLPPLYLLVAIVAAVVVSLVAARGVEDRRAWALAAAPRLLVILIVFGLLQVAVGVGESRLELPLGAILAVWTFAARSSSVRPAGRDRRALAAVSVYFMANALLGLGPTLTGPNGPFAVSDADLNLSLTFECGPPGQGVPDRVPVTFRWSWKRAEPFPNGIDSIAIAWEGQDTTAANGGAGDPASEQPSQLFFLAEREPVVGSGVSQGGGSPNYELFTDSAMGVTFGVDLAEQQFRPGEIALTLPRSTAATVSHGYLDVRAAYVHLGRWTLKPPPSAGCQW